MGNEFDNHFVIGRSGATIYPGKGSNVITIPNKINDFSLLKLFWMQIVSFNMFNLIFL
nr:hypothetical protein [Escherichia coli]